MTQLQTRLVELYSMGPIEKVHASPTYQKLCQDHEGDRAFDGERNMVESLRIRIDDWLESRESYQKQVEFGLRLFRKLKPLEREACRELILLTYGKRWEVAHRSYFEEKSVFMSNASDYFLSFTNRNPNKPGLNLVNRNHQFFIIDVLGSPRYDSADRSQENLVAEAINSLLKGRGFNGFYYPKHAEDNTEVETKLRENCARALAFVQLVQEDIFRYYEGSHNWCYFEYEVARCTGADRILFVQLDPEIRAEGIFIDFEPWFKLFSQRQDALKLGWTRWQIPAAIDENFEKVRVNLANQIERSRDQIYLGVPR
jgi:hypothetical protein